MKIINVSGRTRNIAHQDHYGLVEDGGTVEVPNKVGKSLVQQSDVWSKHVPETPKIDSEEGDR